MIPRIALPSHAQLLPRAPLSYYLPGASFGDSPPHGSLTDLTFIPTLPSFDYQHYTEFACHLPYVKRVNFYPRLQPLPDSSEQVHNIAAQAVNLINDQSVDLPRINCAL